MKKKLLSIIVLAALLLQMIVGTVMAQDANNGSLTGDENSAPGDKGSFLACDFGGKSGYL